MESTKTKTTEKTFDERVAIQMAVDAYLRAKERHEFLTKLLAAATEDLAVRLKDGDRFILQTGRSYYLIERHNDGGFKLERVELI